ncbi:MAG TPA: M20 family metallopeptidase [Bacteroidota bacterium]|nr:M20 family metallopeptidase [Bacteroidota bacterium]
MNYNKQFYFDEIKNVFPKIIEYRHTIHKNPELSFQEINTTKYIQQILNSLGVGNKTILKSQPNKTNNDIGVLAKIGNGSHCIALRADIDALPIYEETNSTFCSQNDGVMHACGHDMHTAMMLGVAEILKKYENKLQNCVYLIFQPGEELLPGGAKLFIHSNIFSQLNLEAIFGQHINPELEIGKIALCSGPMMASTDELHITISGKGGHGAQPHLSNDVVLAASNLVINFQSIITKFRNPLEPAVLSITSIQTGNSTNVFPNEAKLLGTLRTYNQYLRQKLLEKIKENAELCAKQFDCEVVVNIVNGYPPLVNDNEKSEFIINLGKQLFSNSQVEIAEPKMWAEDFAYYTEILPSAFWFLGTKENNEKEIYPLHSSKLLPTDESMFYGTAMLVATALEYQWNNPVN